MAKAKVKSKTKVKLILTPEEAQTLAIMCACVSGDFNKSRRKFSTAIANALSLAGYEFSDADEQCLEPLCDGIQFCNIY